MVNKGVEANIMTKSAIIKLGLKYNLSNAQLRMVNAPMTPMCRVAQGVDIVLVKWHGKTDFLVALINLFDIILGK